jgi:tRNA threonylcarbamoyladenosine biosynthesis protein TsaB
MRVLGIDTATRIGSVGFAVEDRVVVERSGALVGPAPLHGGHGGALAPLVRQTLADAGCRVADLDAIAVSIGPGSFTGLRVALGFAKGLAFAAQVPVVPVPTLDALASVADADAGELVCPILDARKGEVYTALYRARAAGAPTQLAGPMVSRPQELASRVTERCRFLGDAVELYGDALVRALGARALVLPFTHYRPRGGTIALLGAVRGGVRGDALGELEPMYVRPAYVQIGPAAGGTRAWPPAGQPR